MTVSASVFVAKDQAQSIIESIGVKTILYSQTNSSVGLMKKKKIAISVYNCSGVLATLGVLLGRESLAYHDQIPKEALILNVCGCEGFSYAWRHGCVHAIPT